MPRLCDAGKHLKYVLTVATLAARNNYGAKGGVCNNLHLLVFWSLEVGFVFCVFCRNLTSVAVKSFHIFSSKINDINFVASMRFATIMLE
jgi:hypothetical protein